MFNEANEIYDCGIYLRLSREDLLKLDESSSINSQRMIVSDYAKRCGFKIMKEYVDDGYSGGNFDRPGFNELKKDIESGRINCVITKDLSRLGREMYDTGKYIEQYFKENNVRYIAINDSFDSLVGDPMLGIRLGINDMYLRDISKKVLSSFRIKQKNGDFIGSRACFGYIKDPEDHHKLIIDEPAAKIVRYIFDLSLSGLGGRQIAKQLNEENIPIPSVYAKDESFLKNHKCREWKHTTVNYILRNRMYIGDMVQHKYEKRSYNSKKIYKVPDDKMIIVENTHDAIIAKDKFKKVQENMSFRHKTCTPQSKGRYLLSGLLYCGKCGRVLGISSLGKKTTKKCSIIAKCNYYNREGVKSGCTPNRINYNYLEEDILHYLREQCKLFLKNNNFENLIDVTARTNNKEYDKVLEVIEETKNEIEKEKELINRIYNDRLNEIISEDMYRLQYEQHKKKSKELEDIMTSYKERLSQVTKALEEKSMIECKKQVERFLSLEKPTNEMIKRLIDKIVVKDMGDDKREINVYFKFKLLSSDCKNE